LTLILYHGRESCDTVSDGRRDIEIDKDINLISQPDEIKIRELNHTVLKLENCSGKCGSALWLLRPVVGHGQTTISEADYAISRWLRECAGRRLVNLVKVASMLLQVRSGKSGIYI
jgi:hypothetical protein